MNDVRLTGGSHLALVMLDAKLPGFAYKFNVFSGTIGLNLAEKSLDTAIDSSLVEDWTGGCRRRCRLGGGAGELCRCGLPDVAILHYRLQMLCILERCGETACRRRFQEGAWRQLAARGSGVGERKGLFDFVSEWRPIFVEACTPGTKTNYVISERKCAFVIK